MEDYIYDSDQDLFETPPASLADTLPPTQDFLFYFEEVWKCAFIVVVIVEMLHEKIL